MDKTICNRAKTNVSTRNWVLIFFPFLLLFSAPMQLNGKGFKLIFTGDIMLSRNVKQEIISRKNSPWMNLSTEFKTSNFAFGNLEGAIIDSSANTKNELSPTFGIPSSFIPLLKDARFTALSVENNHSRDYGPGVKEQTIHSLIASDIQPVSFDNSPQFFRFGETVISIIAVDLIPGKDHQCQSIPSVELCQKLRLAKNLSNLVIISIHWGSELLEWPNKDQLSAAHWLIAHGADVIIGHHPHVIQDPEMIDGKPVFFSLGNHVFDQKYPATKLGLMVECMMDDGKISFKCLLTKVSSHSFYPSFSDSVYPFTATLALRTLPEQGGLMLQAAPNGHLKQGDLILEAFQDGKKVWQTRPTTLVSLEYGKLDGISEYVFTLERHYSNMDREEGIRPYVYIVDKDGLTARWRGSSLAWPLLDASLLPGDEEYLCAKHRGDSFIATDGKNDNVRVMVYKWNGFGFLGTDDGQSCSDCKSLMQ